MLLFSDNVPLEKEVALKDYARDRGRLLMGPGAGTAMIAGVGLGFANVVKPGRVGVVAAAGTGAQEVMSLLDRWGVGVSQVIGLGGRDLADDVGGRMALAAIRALRDDRGTDVILLVSKPPAPRVAAKVLAPAGDTPLVAALIGLDPAFVGARPVWSLADTLEDGVVATLAALAAAAPDTDRDGRAAVCTRCGPAGGQSAAGPGAVLRRDALLRVPGDPGPRPRARCSPTRRSTRRGACRRRPVPTSASTSARRSTPGAGRTR